MRVTIWDLDYYFAKDKTNIVNSDVQKISSYHKQKGDSINFVLKPYDINRPYDIYYIIKENKKTPNPPLEWLSNPKVKWWGAAYEMRQNWKMPDAMLACRPDYLIYPNHDTRLERAERIRLLGNTNKILPIIQDWQNAFKNKDIIVEDKKLWYCDNATLIAALKQVLEIPNLSFAAPVWIDKIRLNEDIEKVFFQLNLSKNSDITWSAVKLEEAYSAIEWIQKFKEYFVNVSIAALPIKIKLSSNKDKALEQFNELKELIKFSKHNKISIKLNIQNTRESSPYFFIPELLAAWCELNFKVSWLEFLSYRYGVQRNMMSGITDWNKPRTWPLLFRDAIRQTYQDKEFLLLQWGDTKVSELEIPWQKWEEEFKYGL